MRITVLAVPGCPGASVLRERLAHALEGRAACVEWVEVGDEVQAERLGMAGSPTVLVDGVDPFAVPGVAASLSCRLYRGPDGRVEGSPGVEALRFVLAVGGAVEEPLDVLGRGGRGRLAPVAGGLRAVQQAVLRHFAATGDAPELGQLEDAAAAHGRTAADVVAELAAEDFLVADDRGRIAAAYPFSAAPTAHRVRLAGGVDVWAMCAIDALGIPDMLAADAVITSTDPVTGDAVTVTATGGSMTWQPAGAVVYVGSRSCAGAAADVVCGALNFFGSRRSAQAWSEQHPDYLGSVVDQARAHALGRSVFGGLLSAAATADGRG
ncbi:alkylmercury lyase family protein [Streptomyces sp. NPDC051940]|uniref:alkylmercury lyase family protein n=1 Tax=Streptomyces sp. NPDC051940 TaxID=3155675 RepID=UPI00342152DE